MVTIIEIAKLSGCSISTVSKALNNYSDVSEKTRERIIRIAKEAGYVPNATAQSLVRRKSNTIGVIYQLKRGFKNLFFAEILDSFRAAIEQKGYDTLLLSNQSKSGSDVIDRSRFKQVDGLLVFAAGRNVNDFIEMSEINLPILTLDPPALSENTIYSDSYAAIQKACRYLYRLGHRKIAFIQGDLDLLVGKKRFEGYLDFMKENELEPIYSLKTKNKTFSIDEGYQTMHAIFEENGLPEAVCASSDLMALGAIKYLKTNGFHVPKDISIIGFDNMHFCDILEPRLTSIKQDYQHIGTLAGNVLTDMIDKKKRTIEPIRIETSIVVRDSCMRRI
jgi:LacI family transcriptional regulator